MMKKLIPALVIGILFGLPTVRAQNQIEIMTPTASFDLVNK